MTVQLLRMRLYRRGEFLARWEGRADPDDPKSMRAALLGAIAGQGEDDPAEVIGRYALGFQGQTGGWRNFRSGS